MMDKTERQELGQAQPREPRSVRAWREARGISQLSLARQVGAAQSTISDIEAEQLLPNVALALRIARVLGVSVEAIIWRDEATRYRKKPGEYLAD